MSKAWLKDVLESMDTDKGSMQQFVMVVEDKPGGFSDVTIQLSAAEFLLVMVHSAHSTDKTNAPNLNLNGCCEDIKRRALAGEIRTLIRGAIDTIEYWPNGSPKALLYAALKQDTKVILAITNDGTGFMHIADGNGEFYEPQELSVA